MVSFSAHPPKTGAVTIRSFAIAASIVCTFSCQSNRPVGSTTTKPTPAAETKSTGALQSREAGAALPAANSAEMIERLPRSAFVIEATAASAAVLAGWTAYYGNLHSHSKASDGVESAATAYAWAENEGDLAFLCLSEHNHMVTVAEMDAVKAAADASTSASFVGIVGQEFSTINGGNHVNVHDVATPIPATLNSNYRELFENWLPAYAADHPEAKIVCQFNHPDSVNKDYGIATIGGKVNYAGNWAEFVAKVDPWVSLIAIITGPADSSWPSGTTPPSNEHRDVNNSMRQIWFTYLDRGFHLSPVADQDNHRKTWGTRTTSRTGVWLNESLSHDSLLRALQAGRTFASEDKDLRVWFTVDGEPMGSVLPGAETRDVNIQVVIEDGDEAQSHYVAKLFRDVVGDGTLPVQVQESGVLATGETWSVVVEHRAGDHELFLVQVDQEGSADDAWTAPIWMDPSLTQGGDAGGDDVTDDTGTTTTAMFVGSKKSSVYHFPNCGAVKTISPGNYVEYSEAPAGKRLHSGCPTN